MLDLVKAAAIAALAVGLTACATQAERRASGAAEQLVSQRAPDVVRDCLVARLADVRQFGLPYPTPNVAPFGRGYTLSYDRLNGRVFIDVTPREGGSLVAYHKGLPMDAPAKVGEVVRACSAAA